MHHKIINESRIDFPSIIFDLHELEELSTPSLILYMKLNCLCDKLNQEVRIGIRELASICKLSRSTITKSRIELSSPFKNLGGCALISITKGNPKKEEADLYKINDVLPILGDK